MSVLEEILQLLEQIQNSTRIKSGAATWISEELYHVYLDAKNVDELMERLRAHVEWTKNEMPLIPQSDLNDGLQ